MEPRLGGRFHIWHMLTREIAFLQPNCAPARRGVPAICYASWDTKPRLHSARTERTPRKDGTLLAGSGSTYGEG
jgi:hypothetical protein